MQSWERCEKAGGSWYAWLAPSAIGACASRNGLQTIDPQNGRAVIAEPVSARA